MIFLSFLASSFIDKHSATYRLDYSVIVPDFCIYWYLLLVVNILCPVKCHFHFLQSHLVSLLIKRIRFNNFSSVLSQVIGRFFFSCKILCLFKKKFVSLLFPLFLSRCLTVWSLLQDFRIQDSQVLCKCYLLPSQVCLLLPWFFSPPLDFFQLTVKQEWWNSVLLPQSSIFFKGADISPENLTFELDSLSVYFLLYGNCLLVRYSKFP